MRVPVAQGDVTAPIYLGTIQGSKLAPQELQPNLALAAALARAEKAEQAEAIAHLAYQDEVTEHQMEHFDAERRLARVRRQRDKLAELWRVARPGVLDAVIRVVAEQTGKALAAAVMDAALHRAYSERDGLLADFRVVVSDCCHIQARLARVTAAAESMATAACLGCNADDCDDCHFAPFVSALRQAVKP